MSEPIQSIAQNNYILHNIDAKKLYVQEPLFTANSGDAVYVGWRPDETVLWEQTNTAYPAVTANATLSITLSEPISSFEKIKFEYRHSYWPSVLLDQGGWDSREAYVGSNMAYIVQTDDFGIKENSCNFQDRNSLLCSGTSAIIAGFGRQEINASGFSTTKRNDRGISPVRIVGINRKENA